MHAITKSPERKSIQNNKVSHFVGDGKQSSHQRQRLFAVYSTIDLILTIMVNMSPSSNNTQSNQYLANALIAWSAMIVEKARIGSKEPSDMVSCFCILRNLVRTDEIGLVMIANDAVETTVEGMKQHPKHLKVQLYGCSVLHTLAVLDGKSVAEKIQPRRALQHVIVNAMMTFPKDVELKRFAAMALDELSRWEDVKTPCFDSGTLVALGAFMENQETFKHYIASSKLPP